MRRPGKTTTAVVATAVVVAAVGLAGCSATAPEESPSTAVSRPASGPQVSASCAVVTADAPTRGALLGVSLDWDHDSVADYTARLGRAPATVVTFTQLPLDEQDRTNVMAAAQQAATVGSGLLLTLEPGGGLDTVTDAAVAGLVDTLRSINAQGVPVVVRFAHEMNGSWYAWGQRPKAYVAAFRAVADAVHAGAPGSSMMWAPSYGGGYPFTGGKYGAVAGSKDARLLDTNADGRLDQHDDSYAPYYPGDDAVDWVGMSLYHWGTAYPWGENEVPVDGKLVDQLRGRYHHGQVDERVVPDFYGVYGEGHGRPVAITETAALYAPGGRGAAEADIKRAWWREAFDPDLVEKLPLVKMVNWFEWVKFEPEVSGTVDWAVTRTPAMARAFAGDLPGWVVTAPGTPACTPPS